MSKVFIQARDKKLLELLDQFEIMTTRQIQKLVFSDIQYTTMMRRIRRLENANYIKQGVILDDYQRTWTLDKKSESVVGGGVLIHEFKNRNTIVHDTTITELRVHFESLGLAKDWTTGLSMKARAFKNMQYRYAKNTMIPDGLMIELLNGEPKAISVELELTQKSEKRYRNIIANYQVSKRIDVVWYIVSDHATIKAMMNAATKFYLSMEKFRFSYLDQVLNSGTFKIYKISKDKKIILDEIVFNNLISEKTAHPTGVGVGMELVSNEGIETDSKSAISNEESLTLPAQDAPLNIPDPSPPTWRGVRNI